MIAVILIFILLLVVAWACQELLPDPIGRVLAVIVAVAAVVYLVLSLIDEDVDAFVRAVVM